MGAVDIELPSSLLFTGAPTTASCNFPCRALVPRCPPCPHPPTHSLAPTTHFMRTIPLFPRFSCSHAHLHRRPCRTYHIGWHTGFQDVSGPSYAEASNIYFDDLLGHLLLSLKRHGGNAASSQWTSMRHWWKLQSSQCSCWFLGTNMLQIVEAPLRTPLSRPSSGTQARPAAPACAFCC